MSITEAENRLFAVWKSKIQNFCCDGVPDEETYLQSPIKIMFVLKETNDFADGDMRTHIREFGGKKATMVNAARWAKALLGLGAAEPTIVPWSNLQDLSLEERRQSLKGVCWINLKKSTGKGSVGEEFSGLAASESELFKAQMALYLENDTFRPTLIVCCGTHNLFHEYFSERLSSQPMRTIFGDWYRILDGQTPVISFYHPANRSCVSHAACSLVMSAAELLGYQIECRRKG